LVYMIGRNQFLEGPRHPGRNPTLHRFRWCGQIAFQHRGGWLDCTPCRMGVRGAHEFSPPRRPAGGRFAEAPSESFMRSAHLAHRRIKQSRASVAIPDPGFGIGAADLVHGRATLAPLTHLDGTERSLPLMSTMAQPGQLAEAGDIVVREAAATTGLGCLMSLLDSKQAAIKVAALAPAAAEQHRWESGPLMAGRTAEFVFDVDP